MGGLQKEKCIFCSLLSYSEKEKKDSVPPQKPEYILYVTRISKNTTNKLNNFTENFVGEVVPEPAEGNDVPCDDLTEEDTGTCHSACPSSFCFLTLNQKISRSEEFHIDRSSPPQASTTCE